MNSRIVINNELQSIAPQLVQAPVTMPYTLPLLYFSQLPAIILGLVNEEKVLISFPKETPYQVPAGYFEQLASSVLLKTKATSSSSGQQPDDEPVLLSDLPRQMPYAVPNGYFDALPASMLGKVAAPVQQTVPAGYFESLPDVLLAKVRQLDTANELDTVAPLLNTISRKPVQYVPQGYFDNLQPAIGETETTKTAAPVVSLKRKTNWLRYAAAASVVGMLSLGGYFAFDSHTKGAPSIANQPTVTAINDQLASLDASTIENYLQANNTTVQTAFSAEELDKLNNSDVDELLQDFTDQQLKKHIEETPELPAADHPKKPA